MTISTGRALVLIGASLLVYLIAILAIAAIGLLFSGTPDNRVVVGPSPVSLSAPPRGAVGVDPNLFKTPASPRQASVSAGV
jgi:hypothetical protein